MDEATAVRQSPADAFRGDIQGRARKELAEVSKRLTTCAAELMLAHPSPACRERIFAAPCDCLVNLAATCKDYADAVAALDLTAACPVYTRKDDFRGVPDGVKRFILGVLRYGRSLRFGSNRRYAERQLRRLVTSLIPEYAEAVTRKGR